MSRKQRRYPAGFDAGRKARIAEEAARISAEIKSEIKQCGSLEAYRDAMREAQNDRRVAEIVQNTRAIIDDALTSMSKEELVAHHRAYMQSCDLTQ